MTEDDDASRDAGARRWHEPHDVLPRGQSHARGKLERMEAGYSGPDCLRIEPAAEQVEQLELRRHIASGGQ
jgi:hypothetical protein